MKSLEIKYISEMKDTLDGINGVLSTTEEKISELENMEIESIQNEG